MRVSVIGAGVAGLTCALELASRGATVEVLEQSAAPAARGCSWYAGGMLAPWCEQENSGALIAQLGLESIPWWQQHFPPFQAGVVHVRDVVYYLLVTYVALFAATRVLEARRWR